MTDYKHRTCEKIWCPHCLIEYGFSTVEPCYTHQFRCSDELFYIGHYAKGLRYSVRVNQGHVEPMSGY
jgi:hypothetical protein